MTVREARQALFDLPQEAELIVSIYNFNLIGEITGFSDNNDSRILIEVEATREEPDHD